jgi:hypothetical protein
LAGRHHCAASSRCCAKRWRATATNASTRGQRAAPSTTGDRHRARRDGEPTLARGREHPTDHSAESPPHTLADCK